MTSNAPRQYSSEKTLFTDDSDNDFLSTLDLQKLLMVVRRSIFWLLLIVGVCSAAAYIYLRYTKPIYQSVASLQLEMKGIAPTLSIGIYRDEESQTNYLEGESQFIRSNVIYTDVIEKLNLWVSYYAEGKIIDDEKFNTAPFKVVYCKVNDGIFYNTKKIYWQYKDRTSFKLSFDNNSPNMFTAEYAYGDTIRLPQFECVIMPAIKGYTGSDLFYFYLHDIDYLQSYIASNITAAAVNIKARIINVTFKDPNPHKAQAIVAAISDAYLKRSVDNKNRQTKQTIAYLEQQLDTAEAYIERTERDIQSYMDANGIPRENVDIKAKMAEVFEKIGALQEEKLKLSAELRAYRKVLDFIAADSGYLITAAVATTISDEKVAENIRLLYNKQDDLERLLKSYKPTTFAVQQRQQDIQKQTQDLLRLISFNRTNLTDKIYELDKRMRELEQQIPVNLKEADMELRKKQRYLASYTETYNLLLNRLVEMGVSEAGTVPNFQILSYANLPTAPIFPDKKSIYLYAAVASLALCIAFVALRYFMQNKITSVQEVERLTSAPLLGVVPYFVRKRMENSQLVVHLNPKSSISESLRGIRTNLDFISQRMGKRTISVTSTVSGEGKTFIAVNLAGIIALSNTRTIVLDLDLRRPKVHLAFSVENLDGISRVLIGQSKWQDCVRKSDIPTLDYITAGPHPPNPAELLMSEQMTALIDVLKQHYDVIVMDTPPVGIVTDGILVMRNVDLPIYVVRADFSRLNYVSNINRLIMSNNFNKMSIVLNAFGQKPSYGYGYGYGYGYKNKADADYYEEADKETHWLKNLIKRLLKK